MGPGGNGMSHVFLGGMFPVVRTHWTSLPSPLHEIIFSIGMDGMGFGGMGRMGGMWFISSAILFEYFCPVLIPSGKDLQLLLVWFTYCSSRVLISFGWSFFMLLCYKYSWHYNIVLLFSKLLLNLTTELTACVGYSMMIEIARMALSYYLNKLLKDCFLKSWTEWSWALHELAAPSAVQLKAFKWFKARRFSAETCY